MALLRAYFDESYGPDGTFASRGTSSPNQGRTPSTKRGDARCLSTTAFRISACPCAHGAVCRIVESAKDRGPKARDLGHSQYALHGVAVTVDPGDGTAKDHSSSRAMKGTPYAFCAWNCILMIAIWSQENRGGNHSISYIFESGDAHHEEANALMNFGFDLEHNRQDCMYGGHGFLPRSGPRRAKRQTCLRGNGLPIPEGASAANTRGTREDRSRSSRGRRGAQHGACGRKLLG